VGGTPAAGLRPARSTFQEEGTHFELLKNRGIYYKLYQLQYKDQLVGMAGTPDP